MPRRIAMILPLLALLLPLSTQPARAADPMQGIPQAIKQQMQLMTPETRQGGLAKPPWHP
ncbi:hypothetical protein [Magnetospira sp. QH-2]|uniref:hypothetical protein n=1 Tax=Magnetospira sp. (strain QH-2) TaxID=1288970 RepID=UPI0005F9CFB2|nr:hypothetical protein [Magnetospira sp. QH-2]